MGVNCITMLASMSKLTIGYIDDVLNNYELYPRDLSVWMTYTMDNACFASYLNVYSRFDNTWQLTTKLCAINVSIVNIPFSYQCHSDLLNLPYTYFFLLGILNPMIAPLTLFRHDISAVYNTK